MRLLPILLLTGCVINSDKYPRPRDLAPSWLIDRTRVLAIAAEPPEAEPGDVVTFQALIGAPDEAELGVVWLACPVDDEGTGFGCTTDFGTIDLTATDPEALAELGFIGFEPGLPPVYVVPDDLLDALEPEQRLEGSYVLIQATALPIELLEEPLEEVDLDVVEIAYKRLVVSEAATPNHNPTIAAFNVDRLLAPEGAVVHVEAEQYYDLGLILPDGTRELYQFQLESGEVEERVEEPYATWFTTGGEMLATVEIGLP